ADRNRSHWSTSKTPSYTKSVSWQHHRAAQTPRPARSRCYCPLC
ncbi:transposase, partial [Klebsiella pneumoniae]